MSEDSLSTKEVSKPKVIKRDAEATILGTKIPFVYYTRKVSGRSPIFRKHLQTWDEKEGGLIGLMFSDNTLAWSPNVPRHVCLEDKNENDAVTRIQTNMSLYSEHPVINISSVNSASALSLALFVKDCGISPSTLMNVSLVDDLEETRKTERVYGGKVADFDFEKFKEK